MEMDHDSGDDSFTEFDESDYVTLTSPTPLPSSPPPSSPPTSSPPQATLSPPIYLPPLNLSPPSSPFLPSSISPPTPPPPTLSLPPPPQAQPSPSPPILYPETNSTIRTFMNKSTVNQPRPQTEIQQLKVEKRKLIKEIVNREMKRKFESARGNAAPVTSRKKQSLLIPTRQRLLLPLAANCFKVTASPRPAVSVTPTASPSKYSPSVLMDPNSLRKPNPRTPTSTPPKLSVLKASASPRKGSARNSDYCAEVTGSGGKFGGKSKSKEPKKEPTVSRKKMTKEEVDSKKQGHRDMVRGLFGNLDFLVGGGLG